MHMLYMSIIQPSHLKKQRLYEHNCKLAGAHSVLVLYVYKYVSHRYVMIACSDIVTPPGGGGVWVCGCLGVWVRGRVGVWVCVYMEVEAWGCFCARFYWPVKNNVLVNLPPLPHQPPPLTIPPLSQP